jgi:hypothetical protein
MPNVQKQKKMIISTNDRVIIFNPKTQEYLGIPINSTGYWDLTMVSHTPLPHILMSTSCDTGPIRNGDIVKIKSSYTNYENYNILYPSSATGWCWYDKESDSDAQLWKVVKESTNDPREPVYSGDNVFLTNVYYKDSLLTEAKRSLAISPDSLDKWQISFSTL